ncbi:hypothetical protein FJN14_06910 [Alteromonas mediterranea]|uniref:hypothetical protein n=1 Tax=Alteromonas mediterranea TaxID=314275 RepID=UPI00113047BE|nr:hypothetical protein [Alteromonas mediterranea]QDG38188.1 hypothetical protein FJN14_06910 [Alteromonas mediterranea]
MKVPSLSIDVLYLLAIILVSFLLSSCLSTSTSTTQKAQPGDELLATSNSLLNGKDSDSYNHVANFLKAQTQNEFSDTHVSNIVEMLRKGTLASASNGNLNFISTWKQDDKEEIKTKLETLLVLFPKSAKSLSQKAGQQELLSSQEFVELIVKADLDPTLVMGVPASSGEPDILRIGWGGSGAFSSVVEYNGDIYASSDVTGVWKHERPHWYPVVKGLTNYNITGLLVHNNTLLAATKKQILKLGENNVWSPVGLAINTYRNTTLQLYSTSANGTTCFAALEARLGCIDEQGSVSRKHLSLSKLKGVYFSEEDNNYIYGFNDNKLYRIDIFDGSHTLEYTFSKNILRIAKLSNDSEPLVFTQNGIYELGSFANINIELNNKSIVNILIDSSPTGKHFVALGGQWNATIHELTTEPSGLSIGSKVNIVYDRSLPYRHWRKSMTKPIGMPHNVKGKIWFGDYWGIYAYDINSNQFYEKSYDASNFVGTDIHIANNTIYITAMDNGLLSMPLDRPNKFTPIFPRKSSDWLLAGHAWSVDSNAEGVFATLSPWNLSQDYLLSADTENKFRNVQKIDDSNARRDTTTFWGQSYSRRLVLEDDIFVYKDGADNGGLYKLNYSPRDDNSGIQESSSQKLFSSEKNRVYRAFTKYQDSLVSFQIDEQKQLYFHNINSGELTKTVDAPDGLWAFNLEVIDNSLYLLGSLGGAVIYRFNDIDETLTEIVKVPSASAFLTIKNAPDHSITLAGAIDWSAEPNGKVLLQHDNENEWIDITCIMPNQSGAVDIEFTEDGEYVYILQQVSSVVRIEVSELQSYQGCAN